MNTILILKKNKYFAFLFSRLLHLFVISSLFLLLFFSNSPVKFYIIKFVRTSHMKAKKHNSTHTGTENLAIQMGEYIKMFVNFIRQNEMQQ